jgi:hypothetical protein
MAKISFLPRRIALAVAVVPLSIPWASHAFDTAPRQNITRNVLHAIEVEPIGARR